MELTLGNVNWRSFMLAVLIVWFILVRYRKHFKFTCENIILVFKCTPYLSFAVNVLVIT
jgi:hypothetical protein